jgi:hypothetical protein
MMNSILSLPEAMPADIALLAKVCAYHLKSMGYGVASAPGRLTVRPRGRLVTFGKVNGARGQRCYVK